MLSSHDTIATVAVRDLDAARAFYEGKLGLEQEDSRPGVIHYRTGATTLQVYVSSFAGTNQATGVCWRIESGVEALVKELVAAGITFEHYDMPDVTLEGHVHVGHDMKVAWFKDPDGNIHALAEG